MQPPCLSAALRAFAVIARSWGRAALACSSERCKPCVSMQVVRWWRSSERLDARPRP
ncbi:MAG: hypothetical protein IT372_05080 [Polyangiaceae bacterium]|nr:hypothetical protein [Polyangiaceae bacterium]